MPHTHIKTLVQSWGLKNSLNFWSKIFLNRNTFNSLTFFFAIALLIGHVSNIYELLYRQNPHNTPKGGKCTHQYFHNVWVNTFLAWFDLLILSSTISIICHIYVQHHLLFTFPLLTMRYWSQQIISAAESSSHNSPEILIASRGL